MDATFYQLACHVSLLAAKQLYLNAVMHVLAMAFLSK